LRNSASACVFDGMLEISAENVIDSFPRTRRPKAPTVGRSVLPEKVLVAAATPEYSKFLQVSWVSCDFYLGNIYIFQIDCQLSPHLLISLVKFHRIE